MARSEASVLPCFGPFRPVGVVTGDRPGSFTELYEEPMLMVPVRRSFQLYKGLSLQLVRGGPHYEHELTAVAQNGKLRYVAEGSAIHALSHHKPLWSAEHNSTLHVSVLGLLAIDDLLFSFGDDGACVVWGGRTGEVISSFSLELPPGVSWTCAVIPPHYTQKLLVGCSDATLRLYNFASGKLLFAKRAAAMNGGGGSSITALVGSSYKGVVAYGTSDARVVVYQFEKDECIAEFVHDSRTRLSTQAKRHRPALASAAVEALRPSSEAGLAPVTALAFRTDRGDQTLASGNALGEIAMWNLSDHVLEGVLSATKQVRSFEESLQAPHRAAVHTLVFVSSKPFLVSCGADNAMLQFRLDTVDGLALLVRERRGHTGRCTAAAFYNTDLLLTAGEDGALRSTHLFSDRASWEMSQGKLGRRAKEQGVSRDALRLPPATSIACNPARNYNWASIATIHDCCAKVCGWRMDTRALEHKTEPLRTTTHQCTAIALSQCGNYACVGYSSGHLTRIHMQQQSLLHFYAAGAASAHASSKVTGVEIFQLADLVVSCDDDGNVKLWRLTTGEPLAASELPSAATTICAHRPSLLIAAGCIDCTIRVLGIRSSSSSGGGGDASSSWGAAQQYSCAVVRSFKGHRAPVTCLALSPESLRHLVSAAADVSLMVWDLAAATCIAQYRVASPVTSLAFHPDSLFLVTTHAGEPGAFLWTNRLRYGLYPEGIAPSDDMSQCPLMHFPRQQADRTEDARQAEGGGEEDDQHAVSLSKASDLPLGGASDVLSEEEGRIRLTEQGLNHWNALLHLDEIRARNEPLLPPRKAALPFFLPTTRELRPTFIVEPRPEVVGPSDSSRGHKTHFDPSSNNPNELSQMLSARHYDQLLEWMTHAAPALIDLRISELLNDGERDDETGIIAEHNERAATALLQFLIYALQKQSAFDLVQVFLKRLISGYGELLASHVSLAPLLKEIEEEQSRIQDHIRLSYGRVDSLAATFANAYS